MLILLVIANGSIFTFINWQKHQHFQTFAWDTSVFDQQIYLASIGKSPYSSLNKVNGLADHFHPLFLIIGAVLYHIWADPRTLYFYQSFFVSLSIIPLHFISLFILRKTHLPLFGKQIISLSICCMYIFAVASQAMIFDEIHDDVLVSLPLLMMIYFLLKRQWKRYILSFICVLLTKEEYGILGIPFALYIFLTQKNLKIALITFFVGLGAFYLIIYKIMPHLAGTQSYFHFRPTNRPSAILKHFSQEPQLFITKLFDNSRKQEVWATTLISFGLLPLLEPTSMVLPIVALAVRFYDDTTIRRYEFNNHYAAPFIPLVAFVTIIGLSHVLIFVSRKFNVNKNFIWVTVSLYIFGVTIIQNIWFHGPINSLLKKQFYESYSWEIDAYELIKQVPANVAISSQNSLIPHLSHREQFYLFPEVQNAEYIALDLAEGPNKFAGYKAEQIKILANQYVQNKQFKIIWQKNESLLLQRVK